MYYAAPQSLFRFLVPLIAASLLLSACGAPAPATSGPPAVGTSIPGSPSPAGAGTPAAAGPKDAASVASRFQELRAMNDVQTLAQPKFMGRHSGTTGETLGAQYLSDQFRAAGIKPGANGSYLQEFPMTVTEFSSVPELTLVNAGATRSLKLRDDFRPLIGGPAGPGSAQGPAIFAGTGDFTNADVHGMIAMVVPRVRLGDLIAGAERAGAAALLLTTGEDTLLKGENQDPRSQNTLPVFLLTTRGTETLLQGSGQSRETLNNRLRAGQAIDPFPLAFEVRLRAEVETRPISAKNVIALQPAASPTDDTCIVGGHYEEIGPDPDGVVFPAANDNASGTAVMLEMARVMASEVPSPPINILYIGWSGHEEGLLGSEYYVEHPVFPLAKTRCYINLDTVGQGGGQDLLAATSSSQIRGVIEDSVNSLEKATGKRPPVEVSERSSGASDHITFQNKGVATVDFNWTGIFEGGRIHVPEDDATNVDPQKIKTTGQVATAVLVNLVTK